MIVVELVPVALVVDELVVLEEVVELVVDVVVVSGTQLADRESWVRSSEPRSSMSIRASIMASNGARGRAKVAN